MDVHVLFLFLHDWCRCGRMCVTWAREVGNGSLWARWRARSSHYHDIMRSSSSVKWWGHNYGMKSWLQNSVHENYAFCRSSTVLWKHDPIHLVQKCPFFPKLLLMAKSTCMLSTLVGWPPRRHWKCIPDYNTHIPAVVVIWRQEVHSWATFLCGGSVSSAMASRSARSLILMQPGHMTRMH